MSSALHKAIIDSANEVAQWKLRAYLAEEKLEQLQQGEDNGDE